MELIAALIAAGLALIPAKMAGNKGYSFAGFWCLSFFLSFLIGIIVAAGLPDKNTSMPKYETGGAYYPPGSASRCWKCGAYLYERAPFCSKCGADQHAAQTSVAQSYNTEPLTGNAYYVKDMRIENDSTTCPSCGTVQRSNRTVCYKCGAKFID